MNTDCISIITQFIGPKQARKLNVQSAVESFPKKISLRSFNDIRQFYAWCRSFDTSNLEEVDFSICDMKYSATQYGVFGWVPPSVKVLRLSIYNTGFYQLPDYTVEELYLDQCDTDFRLPNSIRRLTLGKKFKGRIVAWPQQLEELTINGWESECSYDAVEDRLHSPLIRLGQLPDSIHTMFLTWGTSVQVDRWPLGLKTLTHESCDDDMLRHWLGVEHAPIPEGVVYNYIDIESLDRDEPEEDYDW